ncbi:NUDIX domain-containing protein (plasmid) [Streptomyces sp. NBC_01527]|uniref:NUDIX hydrolase n=1 Tax=unclassified Streptomyces TaxID=2593676 RepID=UPI002E0F3CC4|nr:NUDIX domain-containing protein [Streptomyces sp. NBC_01230]
MINMFAVPDSQRAAVAIVTNPDREVLLQLRDDIAGIVHPGCWGFPGGSLEAGEDPLVAIKRELHEETGMHVKAARPLFELVDALDDGGNGKLLTVFHIHYAGPVQDLVVGEGRELRFFPLSRLPSKVPSHVAEAVSRFLEDSAKPTVAQ